MNTKLQMVELGNSHKFEKKKIKSYTRINLYAIALHLQKLNHWYQSGGPQRTQLLFKNYVQIRDVRFYKSVKAKKELKWNGIGQCPYVSFT